jgi:DNA-binding beta-propeller fold protein YncE
LVATAGENTVAVADLAEFRLFREVPVGGAPARIVTGVETSYVLTPQTGSVHVIDKELKRVASRKLADQLNAIRIAHDGTRVFAIAAGARQLIEADARSLNVERRLTLASEPSQLAVSSDGWLAVSSAQAGILELLDPRTGRRSRRDFGGPIGDVVFRRDGKLLLVANYQEQALTALEVPSLQVVVHLPLAMQPENLCFNADGGQLFITGKGMDGIAIAFPYLPLEVEQTVLAGRDPGAMACSENPAYLLVASASGSDVCVLNIEDRKILGVVQVGQKPLFLTVTPDSQYALVLNEGSGDMAVIRIPTIQQKLGNPAAMRGKMAAALFTMLPVGSKPVHAVVIPKAV